MDNNPQYMYKNIIPTLIVVISLIGTNLQMDKITDLKFKVWEYKPLTIGLWRPDIVEKGYVEDYINRSGYNHNGIILF